MPTTFPHAWEPDRLVTLTATPESIGDRDLRFYREPNGRTWLVRHRFSMDYDPNKDDRGGFVAEPIDWSGEWPGQPEVRCHTTAASHPWNRGSVCPGHHQCGFCGHWAWIEHHGMADGSCHYCGHRG